MSTLATVHTSRQVLSCRRRAIQLLSSETHCCRSVCNLRAFGQGLEVLNTAGCDRPPLAQRRPSYDFRGQMKNLVAMYLGLYLAAFSANAIAVDVTSYRELMKTSNVNSSEGQYARSILLGYHQGLAEALTAVRDANNGVITYLGEAMICIPSSTAITPKLVEAAIDSGLKNERSNKALGIDKDKTVVGFFAYIGLAELFPCKKP